MIDLQSVHSDFHRRFGDIGPVFIAGGAVRDSLMGRTPKDYDVFVGAEFDAKLASGRCGDLTPVENIPTHSYEPFLRGTWKCGACEVQVMSTKHLSADSLLDTFDWNVCLFAFDGRVVSQRTSIGDIAAGKELRLQRVTYPRSTLRRGFRFSERFKMAFPNKLVSALCGMIVGDDAAVSAKDIGVAHGR